MLFALILIAALFLPFFSLTAIPLLEEQKLLHPFTQDQHSRYPQLLVFVSFLMPLESLKALASQVNQLGGNLVLRGLVKGSFRETVSQLKQLQEEILIDPTLFETYQVTVVPTFVLRKKQTDENKQLSRLLSKPLLGSRGAGAQGDESRTENRSDHKVHEDLSTDIHHLATHPSAHQREFQEKSHDRLSGNVSLAYALEKFAAQGNQEAATLRKSLKNAP